MEIPNAATTAQKKGAAELLILAQLEVAATHGYEICQRIAERSSGVVTFNVASLYPILYDMERRKLITGRWGSGAASTSKDAASTTLRLLSRRKCVGGRTW